ncbi:MAG: DNA polymerase I [Lachnospiraceae bacterium]|nr:DNA polymerase I [Lachnospiraceae bacterium]
MMSKIVLIDGNSIINRAFYGMPDLTNTDGEHTGAIVGFLNIVNKILEEENPDYLAVAFDVKAPTFRHKIYEAYKGTRKSMPDELREQVPKLKELLIAMGITIVEKAGLEADDILGTLAKRAEKAGMEVSLVSGDRDLLQIATDIIKIRIPKTKFGKTEIHDYYTQDVLNEYQVPPLGIIELKALMGDSSDNIPGVPKIGEKTATELLLKYGNIDNLKEHIGEITKKSVRETLEQNFDMAVLSKTLATIEVNADIDVKFEDCVFANIYTKEAYPIFKRLEIKKALEKYDESILEGIEASGTANRELLSVSDEADFNRLISELEKANKFSFDIESDSDGIKLDNDGQLSFDFSEKKELLYICTEKNRYQVDITQINRCLDYFVDLLIRIIERNKNLSDNEQAVIITYDLKKQIKIIGREELYDTDISDNFFDTLIAAYLLNPNMQSYSVDEPYDKYEEYKEKLIETDMYKLFKNIEMPLVFVLAYMEREGIRTLKDDLFAYGETLKKDIDRLETEIKDLAGLDFNVNSPKQLGEILFEKMGIPGGKKTKTGYSTAAEVLEKLAPDYPFVAKILEYRGLTKLKSTYVDGMDQFIKSDSRIHCKFNQTVTATGRISCSEPNLQNIPIRTEQGRLIRKCFVPEDGYVFVDADYSQIELRIMAHMSGDEKLIDAYKNAKDIHRITASEVFSVPFDEVTDAQRRNAKAVNFGIIYGISSFGLSQGLSISRKEAGEYIENYFTKFPGVKAYLDGLVSSAKETGYITTLYGRRRPIPELKNSNFMQRQFGERVAMNAPIQGTAADIMKIAMINVYRRLRKEKLKSRLIIQVHDELLIETLKSETDLVYSILKDEMENACKLLVKMEVDIHSGESWYEAK